MTGMILPEGPPPPNEAAVSGGGFNGLQGGVYGGLSGFSSGGYCSGNGGSISTGFRSAQGSRPMSALSMPPQRAQPSSTDVSDADLYTFDLEGACAAAAAMRHGSDNFGGGSGGSTSTQSSRPMSALAVQLHHASGRLM